MDELSDVKRLAGIPDFKGYQPYENQINDSENKRKIEQEQNITPGTSEWFKLWFGRQNHIQDTGLYSTDMPTGFRGRK